MTLDGFPGFSTIVSKFVIKGKDKEEDWRVGDGIEVTEGKKGKDDVVVVGVVVGVVMANCFDLSSAFAQGVVTDESGGRSGKVSGKAENADHCAALLEGGVTFGFFCDRAGGVGFDASDREGSVSSANASTSF